VMRMASPSGRRILESSDVRFAALWRQGQILRADRAYHLDRRVIVSSGGNHVNT
jgi:hypothetical protein